MGGFYQTLVLGVCLLWPTLVQAQGTVMPAPKFTAYDDNGDPCASCKLYTYQSGTLTPLNTYTTSALSVANANPVVLDSHGRASVYLTSAAYKFILKTAADVSIWTQDGVPATNSGTFPSGIIITGGSFAAGAIYKDANTGFTIGAIGGATNDFTLLNPGGGSTIFRVPTGGTQVVFEGSVNVTSPATIQALGGITAGSIVTSGITIQTGGLVSTSNIEISVGAATGVFKGGNGLVSAPMYSFNSHASSGLYWNSTSSGVALAHVGANVFITSTLSGGAPQPFLPGGAFGTGAVPGASLYIQRNTSGGGAPGELALQDKAGTAQFVWVDSGGLARVGGSQSTETSGDTGGTIIGTQVSTRDTKWLLGVGDPDAALRRMRDATVYRFRYRSGAYSGTIFTGIVADEYPAVMMDADDAHPDGRSFSPVSAFGETVLAMQALQRQLDALRADPWHRVRFQ